MYYMGLDVHKKTISYCVKDAGGRICQEGKVGATRGELDIQPPSFFGPQRTPFMISNARKRQLYFGGLVTAPCEADVTSAAYLANTPVG